MYAKLNKTMPQGWVIDENGGSKTDPNEVLKDLVAGTAALTPLGGIGEDGGGYKGYGYATVVEILSAALQQGSYLKMLLGFEDGKKVPYHLGHFFIAINVEAFTEVDSFKHITGDILRQLRASRKMPGQDRIYTAGEKEYLTYLERKNKGVPVNRELQKDIKALVAELGLTQYHFDF